MGCIFIKERKNATNNFKSEAKVYSWDIRRQEENAQDYLIENQTGTEYLRTSGTINGKPFVIKNCVNSVICLLDFMDSVIINNCVGCSIILGPIEGSAYLRNSTGCVCVLACGQFRTRDCSKCYIFLSSSTKPTIELSTNMHFGTYNLIYPNISNHALQAKLSINDKNWEEVHDFTPGDDEFHWKIIDGKAQDFVNMPSQDILLNHNLYINWK